MTGPQMSPAFMEARIATRRFDHDECVRLRAAGWTLPALAEHFDVSERAVQRVTNSNVRRHMDTTAAAYCRRVVGSCRCGRPMTYASVRRHQKNGQEPRCIRCCGLDRALTVRADTLQCCTCSEWKPDAEFPHKRVSIARRGRHQQCQSCNSNAKRAWRQNRTPEQRLRDRRLDRERRQRRIQGAPMPIPATALMTNCPRCQSRALRRQGDEWRCIDCFAKSDGYSARNLDDLQPPASSGNGAMPAGGTEAQPSADPAAEESTDAPTTTRRYTQPEMLGYLVAWHREHGHSPTLHAWNETKPDDAPRSNSYQKRFGSWAAALELAGLPVNVPGRKSQPAPTPRDVEQAEQPAAPPLEQPADPPATEAPQATLTETPETDPGVIEAPLATTLEVSEDHGGLIHRYTLDAAVAATRTHTVWAVDEARDELQLRYARSLLATLDATEVVDDAGCDFFWQLCDRIERVIGIQEEAA